MRSPGLETEPLFEGHLALVVPRQHRLAKETSASLRDLEDEPFALLSRSLRARGLADALFARARVSPRVVLEADTVATVLSVVRAGLAITVLPEPRIEQPDRLAVVALRPAPHRMWLRSSSVRRRRAHRSRSGSPKRRALAARQLGPPKVLSDGGVAAFRIPVWSGCPLPIRSAERLRVVAREIF